MRFRRSRSLSVFGLLAVLALTGGLLSGQSGPGGSGAPTEHDSWWNSSRPGTPLDNRKDPEADFRTLIFQLAEYCGYNLVFDAGALSRGAKFGIFVHGSVPRKVACETFRLLMSMGEQSFYTVGGFLRVDSRSRIPRHPLPLADIRRIPTDPKVDFAVFLFRPETMASQPDAFDAVVRWFISPQGRNVAFKGLGYVMVVDEVDSVRRIMQMMQALDDKLAELKLFLVEVKHMKASDLAKWATDLFPKPNQSEVGRSGAAAPSTEGMAYQLETAIGDDRTGRVVLIANEATHQAVLLLRDALDMDMNLAGASKVYYLQHQLAKDLVGVITGIQQARSGGGTGGQPPPRGTPPPAGGGGTAPGGVSAGDTAGVKIVADEKQNALLLVGDPRGLSAVESLIRRLDRPRAQVFLEVHVVEATVRKNMNTGLALYYARRQDGSLGFVSSTYAGASPLSLTPSALQGLAVLATATNDLSGGIVPGLRIPSFGVVLKLIEESADAQVLSSPFLLAADGEEAQLSVGQNVPFISTGNVDQFSFSTVTIQRQDIAFTLKMKPQVRAGMNVALTFEMEIQDLVGISETMGPTTSKRAIKTRAMVADSTTAVLGGLRKKFDGVDRAGIPGLGDIPVVRDITGTRQGREENTDLLIFVTPYVVRSSSDIRRIHANKLRDMEEYERLRNDDPDAMPPPRPTDYERGIGLVEAIRQSMRRRPAPATPLDPRAPGGTHGRRESPEDDEDAPLLPEDDE